MKDLAAKWNMKKDTTPNNRISSHWILYRDGEVVFKGFRRECFNMIYRGNPAKNAPVIELKEVTK